MNEMLRGIYVTTVLNLPKTLVEGRIVLHHISWQTYERILEDLADCSVPHLTYDRGELEIMSPTALHESLARKIDAIVTLIALELEIEVGSLGSTTFKRGDLQRGFEPDSCFYFRNESLIRGKKEIDLTVDPPPDLVVEIDITRSSVDKRALIAQFGVPEVWRHDGRQLEILQLRGGSYAKTETSSVLPFVTPQLLTDFVAQSLTLSPLEWMNNVREWARQVTNAHR
jgi:Uma2 family endonuclease